ncbi:MAG TPA: tetratricopeptide repeat protein [Candidatus Krumholzibacteria bacterium]|nr:tetratricopeptide repeat protein [Candidatus Krumholzibacteria bacterium]
MNKKAKPQTPESNVIRFPVEAVSRFGFKRAEVRRGGRVVRMEEEGQMNLFDRSARLGARMGAVVPLPMQMGAFEAALVLDDANDPRAEAMYQRAIEEGDFTADAWCNLGVLKSVSRALDEAFQCFAQSLSLEPRHAESHYNIGNLYFEYDDLKLARMHYEKAIECDSALASAYFNLGLVTALTEDYRVAYDSLLHYKNLAPNEDASVADELLRYLQTAIRLS